jgi:spermidine synthase
MGRRNKSKERAKRREETGGQRARDEKSSTSRSALFDRLGLKLLVFVAGAVLMALEIAGSRVLAPHFGNSVFVWGSLISVFLIALSGGYYLGGRIADRHPSRILLNSICVVVAFLILTVALYAHLVCEWLVDCGLGEQSGPFVASLLLFLPASVGMGIVSPFAVRLAADSINSLGKIAGTLYALSTMGSIAGTLLTTFVLIPLIGLTAILKGLAVALLLVAILTLPLIRRVEGMAAAGAVVLLALLCWSAPAAQRTPLRAGDVVLLDVDTPYHHISVVDNEDRRDLRFDRYIESSIRKTPPFACALGYTDYFHLSFLVQPKIRRSLFIGAGGGVGPRTFSQHDPDMLIDVVDIDPKILEIARTHFRLENTARIRTIAADGRMFLRKAEQQYDCVVLDAFSTGGRIPFHLVTREFLSLCRDKMSDRGVFVININSALEGPASRIFFSVHRTVESVFPETYVFAKDHRTLGSRRTINIILLASKAAETIPPEKWTARAERHQSDSYVKRDHMRRMAADLMLQPPDVAQAPLLTDDYAPIETMSF